MGCAEEGRYSSSDDELKLPSWDQPLERKEILLFGRVEDVRRVRGELPDSVIKLDVAQRWLVSVSIEMIEENPTGLVAGQVKLFAMDSLMAGALGVFSNPNYYESPRFFVLSFRRRGEAKWVPVMISTGSKSCGFREEKS